MYWILFLYLMVAYFVPEVGVIALICMVGPIAMAVRKAGIGVGISVRWVRSLLGSLHGSSRQASLGYVYRQLVR